MTSKSHKVILRVTKRGPQGNFEGERKNLQQGSQQGAPQGNSASSGASDEEILNLLLAE